MSARKTPRKRIKVEYSNTEKFWVEIKPSGITVRQFKHRHEHKANMVDLIDFVTGQMRLKL